MALGASGSLDARHTELVGWNVQIQRAMILAQLARGDSIQSIAEKIGVHPFIIAHVQRHRLTRRRGTRRSVGRRGILNPETLRAAIAAGKTIETIFKESQVARRSSVYKALARWKILFPKQREGHP
jgi:hypothetical protein